ncbi:MAG: undecaprenyl-diphosphate phosphatase [Rickettsiales bacterium]|nr:undecaprenyl-diphosphate phosphatase [Rickettsiales bacterium]
MDSFYLFQTLLLGLLEGLTEFLPISSTGHLILAIDLMGFKAPKGKVFEVVIQLGAILSVCWVYRMRLWDLVRNVHKKDRQRFILLVTLAFLPSALIGVLAHGYIKSVLFSPIVVACSLIVGGVIILLTERLKPTPHVHHCDAISYQQALLIGCAQAFAVIPGTSRLGATVVGGLWLGLDRRAIAEFSFFLAIPTMLGATVYDIYKNYAAINADAGLTIAIGFMSAFVAGMVAVRWLLAFIARHDFTPFAWYRLVLGTLMLLWFGFGASA